MNFKNWLVAVALAAVASFGLVTEAMAQTTTQVYEQPTQCDASGCTYTQAIVTETVWPDGSKTYSIRFVSTFVPYKVYTQIK